MKAVFANKTFTILIIVIVTVVLYFLNPLGLDLNANKVIAVAFLMVTLWVTEAMPMPVVALLPLVLFPLLNVSPIDVVATSYSNPVIFLFLGGFLLGLAIEKWNLHRRIALNIVKITGTSGNRIVLGFIIATGLISMWLSNTATTMMMFPIALSVIHVIKEKYEQDKYFSNFSLSLMLAISLASNFGGIGTIIGTPPNVAYVAYLNKHYNMVINFSDWMIFSLPIAVIMLLSLYVVTVKWLYPNKMKADAETNSLINIEIAKLGKLSKAEKRVMIIFVITALLWITKDLINKFGFIKLDDTMIALIGGISLFVFRSGNEKKEALLAWDDTKRMAWGILLLFGGGIALAGALEKAGLIQMIATWMAQYGQSTLMMIFLVTFLSLFISEVTSNVAQVIVFAPIVSGLAVAANLHPLILGIPMTLAASCASMLPMGTPPNAIAFSSGYIKLHQMTRVGFIMNMIAVIIITLFSWLILPIVFTVN